MAALRDNYRDDEGKTANAILTFDVSFRNETDHLKEYQKNAQTDLPLRNISFVVMSDTYMTKVECLNRT